MLGELPTPQEDLTTTTTTTTGGSSTSATTAQGGGGQGGTGGSGGATTGGSTSTGGSTETSTETASGGGGSGGSGGGTTTSTGQGGGCCSPCDCDCDGFPAAGACAGTGTGDCDDTNDAVYPGEPIYYVNPSPNNGFDWDCSGAPNPDPAMTEPVNCVALAGIGCPSKVGFLGTTVPACGQPGTWGTCKKSGLQCLSQPIEEGKKMACK